MSENRRERCNGMLRTHREDFRDHLGCAENVATLRRRSRMKITGWGLGSGGKHHSRMRLMQLGAAREGAAWWDYFDDGVGGEGHGMPSRC